MDKREVCFLDFLLMGGQDKIYTGLYRQPLSCNCLLQALSGLPKHTIKSITVIKFFCTDDQQFEHEIPILYQHFLTEAILSGCSTAYDLAKARNRWAMVNHQIGQIH